MNKLKIVEQSQQVSLKPSIKKLPLHEIQATFETRWKQNPGQFCTKNHMLSHLRIERTKEILSKNLSLPGLKILDIGSGDGTLALWMQEMKADVIASDASSLALQGYKDKIKTMRQTLPLLTLDNGMFDLVVCADVIASLPSNYQRLALCEISRLLKRGGLALISTPFDPQSFDAHELFCSLLQTEFEIVDQAISTHYFSQNKFTPEKWILKLEKLAYWLWEYEGATHGIYLLKRKEYF